MDLLKQESEDDKSKKTLLGDFFSSAPEMSQKRVPKHAAIEIETYEFQVVIPCSTFWGCITFDKTYALPKSNIAPGNGPGPQMGKYTSPQFSGAFVSFREDNGAKL